jgi:hypothetical protein
MSPDAVASANMSAAPEAGLEPLREAVRELAGVVADQQLQLEALRDAIEAGSSPPARAHFLARFEALRAGQEPPAQAVVEVPAEDPYAWL